MKIETKIILFLAVFSSLGVGIGTGINQDSVWKGFVFALITFAGCLAGGRLGTILADRENRK